MNSTKEHHDNEESHNDSVAASVEDDEDFTVKIALSQGQEEYNDFIIS